jgi:hypothetical protein
MGSSTGKLQQEIATYESKRSELFAEHAGEFVLVKGDEVVDIYRDERDAIDAGYKKFGNTGFLVRKVAESEKPVLLTSLHVSVTRG